MVHSEAALPALASRHDRTQVDVAFTLNINHLVVEYQPPVG
jgi:hypothetical protein